MESIPESVRIAPTAIVHPNVTLGENVIIEDFCIVGYPPNGVEPGEIETVIGANTRIRTHTIIYAGAKLGNNCHISHMAFIREHAVLGNECSVGANVIIEHNCKLGDRVRLQGQAGMSEHTVIEEDAWIGPRTLMANVYHPTCNRAKECLNGPIIRKGAIIGGNAAIVPDIEVGERAFIGLGCIITKSVPNDAVMATAPAKEVGDIKKMPCRYEMIKEDSPFVQEPIKQVNIPMVDIAAQHQNMKQDIRLAIDRVILNTRFINGKEVDDFEANFAEFCQVPHVIGVSSGSDALMLALKALGVGEGDEVITTTHTFIATVEAILNVNAKPVFVDIEEDTFLMDLDQVEQKITDKTKAIIPVHIHGQPVPMDRIASLAKKHGLLVVEDAAQAQGASFDGHPVGQLSDAACFSFFPCKNLGAYGDAGAVITRRQEIADSIRKLRDHGRINKYESDIIGYNARLDTIHAAILKVKLKRLGGWNDARKALAKIYRQGLEGLPVTCQRVDDRADSVYHHFVISLDDRDGLQEYLKHRGVASGIHYPVPMHRQPALSFMKLSDTDFPVANKVTSRILSLPMYPELEPKQAEFIVDQVKNFFADEASK